MEERKVVEEGNFFVTTERVIIGNKVIPVNQIANAVPFFDDNWKGAAVFIVVGLIGFAFGGMGVVIGLIAIVLGILFWIYVRNDALMIVLEGGGHELVKFGRDRQKIREMAGAVVQAIQINASGERQSLRDDISGLKSIND